MRSVITFPCEGETLVGTLDGCADADAGLLIVSGGNEVRSGAHRGMAMLAADLARVGVPVFRFDRRGVGDSGGENGGWESSGADIAAAAAVFRRAARVIDVTAFGNCDAATALALFHADAGIDTVVLSNPWIGGADDGLPPAAAIRTRYAERLRDPREWLRLASGRVSFGKIVQGLRKAAHPQSEDGGMVDRMADAMTASEVPATILLAARDNTAIGFADAWARCRTKPDVPIHTLDSASHSYAGDADAGWLHDRLHEVARYSAA